MAEEKEKTETEETPKKKPKERRSYQVMVIQRGLSGAYIPYPFSKEFTKPQEAKNEMQRILDDKLITPGTGNKLQVWCAMGEPVEVN